MIEIIVNVLGIAIAAFLYIFSRDFSVSTRPGIPSAAFFPTIICVALLILGIYNLVKIVVFKKKHVDPASESIRITKLKVLQMLAIVSLMALYAVLWNYKIGHFILNSIICFTPICWLLGDEVEWWKSAIYIVGLTIFIYLLFGVGLKVRIW